MPARIRLPSVGDLTLMEITTRYATDPQAQGRSHRLAGDYRQADICDRALSIDPPVNCDGDAIAFADWPIERAREECAQAIADAEAQS